MDDSSNQYLMWMKRKQVLKSHLQSSPPPTRTLFGDHGIINNNNNNYNNYYFFSSSSSTTTTTWEERAFAEDAARILGGSTWWPPRSYSCTFCSREFRSAQALGGHMNVHRRDRARLKQNLIINTPHHHHHHHHEAFDFDHHHLHKNDYNSLLGENCGEHDAIITTPSSPSSIILGKKMGSPNNTEHEASERVINITRDEKEHIFKGLLLDCDDDEDCSVETGLSMGLSSMCGQKSTPNDEDIISCKKRLKSNNMISSQILCGLETCSKNRGIGFHSAEIVLGGLNHHGTMEDLDLELRLGKHQKVK